MRVGRMPRNSTLARYLRAHHWRGLAIAAAAVVADVALSVHTDVSAPAASNSGYISVPLALQVPLIIVCLVASSIDGKMAKLEESGDLDWYGPCLGQAASLEPRLGTAAGLVLPA